MDKVDLKEVLELVKEKLGRDAEPACLFWDGGCDVTTEYSVGEEG